ncbi:sensor histidine kinase KdpD [uncultured Erythrobacter sp.]|uniref:sensor histidine kinase n=1 Tax=uncultured Erythrobacter sp. TaxID=263913 RepID=UPI0026582227|nr:HAMP domain-containing sensor histidine kinase [uncultured Erythrobacter sp.]
MKLPPCCEPPLPYDLSPDERPVPTARAVLQLLVGQAHQKMIAFVGSFEKRGRISIDEAFPQIEQPGETIAAPEGLCDGQARLLSVADGRLPLAWTSLCGARPVAIASVPVVRTDRFLICASAKTSPDLVLMSCAAETISRLHGVGPLTARDYHSSQGLQSLVNNLPVPLIFVDSRTIEVFLNEPARALLEMPQIGLSNRRVAARLARLASDAFSASGGFNLASAPYDDFAFEIERDGRAYNVESRWVDDGVLLGRMWMFRDVTKEHAAARIKDQLVATVSHELRTPLTAIIGSLGLLQAGAAGALTEQSAKLVGMARKNGERLVKIVNDLLDMEKMQSGKMDYDFSPVDLTRLVGEVVQQNMSYTQGFGVEVLIDTEMVPVTLLADEGRVAQVLTNLISNAAKFSPRGSQVFIRLEQLAETARISVIDQGRGISKEFRQELFARFSQDRESAVTGHPGSGLGLAISRSIIEAHGGTIRLDETTTCGSTFHVELPLVR